MAVAGIFKQSDMGLIPEDWGVTSLETLSVKNGLIRGPFGGSLKKEFFVSSGYKVYEQANAIREDMDLGNYYVNAQKYEDLKRFAVREGDFIVSCSGTIGKIYRLPRGIIPGIINQALLKIRIDDSKIVDDFFLHYFRWGNFQARIVDNTQGGAMQNLVGMNIFREIAIPIPPRIEQLNIAAALSDVDALLAAQDALIAKKRLIKQGAMQELLTGKRRLPGFRDAWQLTRLGDIAPLQRGFDLPNSELRSGPYPVVYSNGVLNSHANYKVKPPGVVTGRSGTLGKVTYMETYYWPHNTSLWVTTFNDNSPKFVYYLYKFINFERLGTGSGVPTLNRNDVHSFETLFPRSVEEQMNIAGILNDMDAEIAALEAEQEKTRLLKQGMMQELLTGRIRLV